MNEFYFHDYVYYVIIWGYKIASSYMKHLNSGITVDLSANNIFLVP